MKSVAFILFLALAACSSQPKGQDPLLDTWEKNVALMFGTSELAFSPETEGDWGMSGKDWQFQFSADAKVFKIHPMTIADSKAYLLEKTLSATSAVYTNPPSQPVYTNITFTIKDGKMEAKLYSRDSVITNATHEIRKKK